MSNERGVMAVHFKCPRCASDRWGTRDAVGVCRGYRCGEGKGGAFTWSRAHDFRFFVRDIDGTGFETPEQYEETIGVGALGIAIATTRRTLPEMLHELLEEIMERPPTIAVVQMWKTEELRAALHWCSRELAARGVWGDGRRVPRPEFIEEGAATA